MICSPDRTDNSTEVNVLCDLVLASVRDCARGTDCGPYTFEVQHANVRTYVFQAEGPKEHQVRDNYSQWQAGVLVVMWAIYSTAYLYYSIMRDVRFSKRSALSTYAKFEQLYIHITPSCESFM